MKDLIFESLQRQLKKYDPKADLFSHEVVLSFRFMEFRAFNRVFGGPAPWGAGEFLVHKLIGPAERRKIFTSPYDLGNRAILDGDWVRQGKLINHLSKLVPCPVDETQEIEPLSDVESVVKDLKKFVREITRRDYIDYTAKHGSKRRSRVNSSYAVKTIYTLYRYRLQWPKIFSRFRPATGNKANLEFRDAHPLRWHERSAKDGVAVYADLKCSLTHGMGARQYALIKSIMTRISDRYASTSYPGGDVLEKCLLKGGSLHVRDYSDIDRALPLGDRKLPERIDISMYFGLVFREIQHREHGKQLLNKFLTSEEAKLPAFPNLSLGAYQKAVEFLLHHDYTKLLVLIQYMTGQSFSGKELMRALELSESLKWVIKVIKNDNEPDFDPNYYLAEKLVAIITCIGDESHKVRSKAYWHGKENSSDRPVFYLQKLHSRRDLEMMPEHYQEYWFRRYTLTMARLYGQEEAWQKCNSLEQHEAQRVMHVFETHHYNDAIPIINKYLDRFKITSRPLGGWRIVKESLKKTC